MANPKATTATLTDLVTDLGRYQALAASMGLEGRIVEIGLNSTVAETFIYNYYGTGIYGFKRQTIIIRPKFKKCLAFFGSADHAAAYEAGGLAGLNDLGIEGGNISKKTGKILARAVHVKGIKPTLKHAAGMTAVKALVRAEANKIMRKGGLKRKGGGSFSFEEIVSYFFNEGATKLTDRAVKALNLYIPSPESEHHPGKPTWRVKSDIGGKK